MNRDEQQFIDQARAALDMRSDQVSPHIAARLRQARHTAIASPYRRTTSTWVPALSTAMLVLVIAMAWFAGVPHVDAPTSLPVQQAAGDFEMLVHGEDLELFADMDFYLWLEQRSEHAG
jgi:hypothetical protein